MAHHLAIALPGDTTPTRAELYGVRWMLERRSGSIFCVAMDDTLLFEGHVGVPDEDLEARVEVRFPEHPVELTFSNSVVLAPRSRMLGWIPIPSSQRFVVSGPGGDSVLATTHDRDLRLGFREGEGYHHAQDESFRDTLACLPRDRNRIWLAMTLENQGSDVWRPKRCRLELSTQEIVQNGDLCLGPRVVWTRCVEQGDGASGHAGKETVRLDVPRLPGAGASTEAVSGSAS
ncbi:MAG: hypothetical protein KDC95_08290 [Planctomycetes bacterium]|nr:hypothetical protein [Planctomycetota bacterium]